MKRCNVCEGEFPQEDFYSKQSSCKACHKKKVKEYQSLRPEQTQGYRKKHYEANKETFALKREKWKKENPEKYSLTQLKHNLAKKYNLSEEQYNQMFLDQENCCAICKISFENTKANVDHNHVTGKARELLCHNCNKGIGHLKENIEFLKAAIGYLEKHNL